jgi:hypothetical protein
MSDVKTDAGQHAQCRTESFAAIMRRILRLAMQKRNLFVLVRCCMRNAHGLVAVVMRHMQLDCIIGLT